MPVDLVALAHAQSRQVSIHITIYTCNTHSGSIKVCVCVCMCVNVCVLCLLTVHLVALNKIFILFQASGRVCDVRPDVFVDVPAEVLIRHHEEQSIHVVSRLVSVYVQSSYRGEERRG